MFKRSRVRGLVVLVVILLFAVIGYLIIHDSKAVISADINNDRSVGIADLTILAANYGQNGKTFSQGDLNGDTVVNIFDFSTLAAQWNMTTGGTHSTGYNKLGFYPCDAGATTYGAQQVTCMNNLANWLGRTSTPKIPYVVLMTDGGSPSLMSGNGWGAVVASGAYQTVSPKPIIVLSVPLAFGTDGCNNSPKLTTCFDKVANGTYDSSYQQLIQYFINAGYDSSHLIIRLGWEYDGDWMPWSARNNPTQFIAAYRHVHDVMKDMPGLSTLKFDLAGDPRQTSPNSVWQTGNNSYPGDTYVDIIGMDIYSVPFSSSSCTPDTFTGNAQPSLTAQRDFAIAHGKQVSYPEWGQKTNPDCANFIQDMYDWMNSLPSSGGGSLAYHSYFNIASNEGSNSSFKLYDAVNNLPVSNSLNAEAKFKSLFGNQWC